MEKHFGFLLLLNSATSSLHYNTTQGGKTQIIKNSMFRKANAALITDTDISNYFLEMVVFAKENRFWLQASDKGTDE